MTEISEKAINTVKSSILSFCRFITANDTGETGSHQGGFYIPKTSYTIFFDQAGKKGSNKEKFIKIKWQNDFGTTSRAIYYGQGTRNEYRLTQFGRGFPFLQEEYTGSLLIISKMNEEYYEAYVLNNEEDIEDFLDTYGMSPADTNTLINQEGAIRSITYEELITQFIKGVVDFPKTKILALTAREICEKMKMVNINQVKIQPDEVLLNWLTTEYEVFRKVETLYYLGKIKTFSSIDEFSNIAHSFINRRMTRAGSSLENQLEAMFLSNSLLFDHPGKTEEGKKPDFLFPGNKEYHTESYNASKLIFLGSKTTCKDRWRQILNEADRIPSKHLFTLQQGISKNQLKEMYASRVTLVVPKPYIDTFPEEYRDKILDLESFISYAEEKQSG